MKRSSVPSAGLETAIPSIERLQNCTLDRTATEIGLLSFLYEVN
jgi:hypothetical protein